MAAARSISTFGTPDGLKIAALGIFGAFLSCGASFGGATKPGRAVGSLIAPNTVSFGSSRPKSMPADTTVLTSSPSGSVRPGLNTRKKIASLGPLNQREHKFQI